MANPLPVERLYRRCEFPGQDFVTTDDLKPFDGLFGQTRAGEAMEFGLAMRHDGFNLFVMGPPGAGKQTLATRMVAEAAARGPVPPDRVYVNNFSQPHKPRAITLPAGQGRGLQADMRHLIEDLLSAIPAIFESDEYRARVDLIDNEFSEREATAFGTLGDEARAEQVALLRTPNGFGLAPMHGDEVIDPEAFEKLPEAERLKIGAAMERLHERLHKLIRQLPHWQREKRERMKALNREFSELAVEHQLGELREKYAGQPAVLDYLAALEQDLIENADDFRKPREGNAAVANLELTAAFRRYQVNVLVDHAETRGAPVVAPDQPGYANLMGRIEHIERLGTLITDFTLLKPGALHQANGGYLLLDARKLLMQPYAWEGLKRALRARQVRMESLGQMLSLVSTVSLEPEPIPLDVKVVLMGERHLYYLLYEYDPDFAELFKVAADFEDAFERDVANEQYYARLIATQARQAGLRPFERAACARLVEQAAREAEDAEKLSANMQSLVSLMREADFQAQRAGRGTVSANQVQAAVAARRRRGGRLRERYQEEILRGTLRIDTESSRVGQVNGLAVVELGEDRFAHPVRITATVRLGEGEVVDIQREVELAGAIHSKGVLTLSAFLATRYASGLPLSLSATLSFEQTYGEVEGDSASIAELCALLSAIGDIPLRQDVAVTGSVDLYGEMQAIGGVNEKIEGFFDLCQARGLTGRQGVVIPEANVKYLMLRGDVVEACANGRFQVWSAASIDDAVALLSGLPAGEPDTRGVVPEGSVNYLVAARLLQYSTLRQAFASGGLEKPHRRPGVRKKKPHTESSGD